MFNLNLLKMSKKKGEFEKDPLREAKFALSRYEQLLFAQEDVINLIKYHIEYAKNIIHKLDLEEEKLMEKQNGVLNENE